MTYPTCNVLCTVLDDAGIAVEGAHITAKLNRYEVFNGYVIPETINAYTDSAGHATLALWPNQLGSTESSYIVKIRAPNGKTLTTTAIVPNTANANLHEISTLPPYPGKTDGELILDSAIAAGATAVSAAIDANTAKDAAAASATAAGSSASAAAGSANTASTQAGIATTKATEASGSATAASGSATTAAAQAGIATTKAGEASASASAAAGSASTAITKANDATSKANDAASSAALSSDKAAQAVTKAAEAAASASLASTKASDASGSASAAAASASAASGSASTASDKATLATTKAAETANSSAAAGGFAVDAQMSAAAAAGSLSAATAKANEAATSSAAAAGNAATILASVAVAADKAALASSNAAVTITKAAEASASASAAAGSATAAENSKNTVIGIYGSAAAVSAAASAAAASASAAATSKTGADTSAAAAAASAASAAAIVTGVASNRPSIRPTLLLDFANTRTLDPRITFGRSSPAMAYDGKTTVMAEQNLLLQSQDYTVSPWIKGGATITGNAVVAPDGTTTAGKMVESATTAEHYLTQSFGASALQYTFSVFAKAGERTWLSMYLSTSAISSTWFDLVNGIVGTVAAGVTASISPAGNGWYRCSITKTLSAATFSAVLDTALGDGISVVYAGDASKGLYLWGAQVENRAFATAYTPTTTTAITNYIPALQTYAANVARFDVNPVTGESLGLMVEEARTNICPYSQDLDVTSAWKPSGTSAVVVGNVAIAPDGTLTADKIYDLAGTVTHYIEQALTRVASTTYTFSVYLKAAEYTSADIGMTDVSSGQVYVTANLSAGTVGSVTYSGNWSAASAAITAVGNGWYRVSITATGGTGTSVNPRIGSIISANRAGDPTKGFLAWGAQLEAGAFATSYIPTLLTYSGRGSTATFIGDNGLIQTAQANTARYQRNIAGAVQMLLEGAGSNLVAWSQQFDNSAWAKGGGSTGGYVLPNMAIAPDGTFSADMLLSGGGDASFGQPPVLSAGIYTFSVWLKAGSRNSVGLYSTMNSATVSRTCSLTSAWQLFSLTFTYNQAGAVLIGAGSTFTSGSIYAWGAQLESGSVATSYMPSIDSFTSRSGTATYYDSGTVALAEQNILQQSQTLSNTASWTADGVVVTADAIAAPDGTTTAELLTSQAINQGHYLYNSPAGNRNKLANTTYTLSVFAKANGYQYLTVSLNGSSSANYVAATFNLSGAGSVTKSAAGGTSTLTGSTITALANGWYRCTVTGSVTEANGYDIFSLADTGTPTYGNYGIESFLADGTSGIYLWGVQLEQRASASDYTPTTSAAITNYIPRLMTAPSGLARYDFDPVTRLSKGLLLEAAAANLLLQSAINTIGWNQTAITITASAVIAPDGTLSAAKIASDTSTGAHFIKQVVTTTAVQTTFSFYAKYAGCQYVYADAYLTAAPGCYFDILNGLVSTPAGTVTPTIQAMGNGWYRCSISFTAEAGSTQARIFPATSNSSTSFAGDGWKGAYLWGCQLETGSVATSYIPTTSAQVTRAADVGASVAGSRSADVWSSAQATRAAEPISMTGSNFSSWFKADQGTLFADYYLSGLNPASPGINQGIATINDGNGYNNSINLINQQSSGVPKPASAVFVGGSTQINPIGSAAAVGTEYKLALAYQAGNFAAYANGSSIGSSSTGNVPNGMTQLMIGQDYSGTSRALNGYIKRIAFYPKRIVNAECVGLTS